MPDTVAVLYRSGRLTFLDFSEKPGSLFSTGIHLQRLFEVRSIGEQLEVAMLETDRVQKLAAQGALDTEFADTEQGIILTARPEELQKFVSNQVHDGLVFGEIHRLHHPGPGE